MDGDRYQRATSGMTVRHRGASSHAPSGRYGDRVARRLVLRELVDPLWPRLADRGFVRFPSGVYRLGAVPMWLFVERQPWTTSGESMPRVDWRMFIGAPGAQWEGDGLDRTILTLSLDQQRDSLDLYQAEDDAQRLAIVDDFAAYFLPIVDQSSDPANLARGLLDGAIAPWQGRRRNRIGAADGALELARAFGLRGLEPACVEVQAAEARISSTRAEAVTRVAERHGLDLFLDGP